MEEREVGCEGGLGSGERNSSCCHHSAHFSLTTPSLLMLIAPLSSVLRIPHILTSHTLTPHLHILTPHIPTLHIPIPHIPTLVLAPCPALSHPVPHAPHPPTPPPHTHPSQVNLLGAQNKKSRQLSGGMKRRLSVAMANIGNPDILILDEPTTGLGQL